MRDKTIYAPGAGIDCSKLMPQADARARLGIDPAQQLVVVLGGGGGTGLPSAPLTLGARADADAQWVTLGAMQTEWHETPPGNLTHLGWVNNPEDWICAADRVVSSCGNTTVHMVAAAGKPWIVVPEWRYFSEQYCKAEALDAAGIAATSRQWPASAEEWQRLWRAATAIDPQTQRALVHNDGAASCGEGSERTGAPYLGTERTDLAGGVRRPGRRSGMSVSVCTLAHGRAGHMHNLVAALA